MVQSAVRVLLRVFSFLGAYVWVLLALALLVPGVRADHHDAAVATDDPALAADLLDARLDLHGKLLLMARTSWRAG